MNNEPFTEQKVLEVGNKIAKVGYRDFMKTLTREINKIPNSSDMTLRDYIAVVIVALTTIDKNVLLHLKKFYQTQTNDFMDMSRLLRNFIENVSTLIDDNEYLNKKDMN